MTEQPETRVPGDGRLSEAMPRLFRGLSGRLLLLTMIFVMLAEVLIFVPSVSNMRTRWMQDRLNTAAAAGVVIDGLQPVELPRNVQEDTLVATGAKAIVLRKDKTSRLIAASDMPPQVDDQYDLAKLSDFAAMRDTLDTLLFGGDRMMRVFGPVGDSDMIIELVLPDAGLRKALWVYSINVFLLSLFISVITAVLIFLAINRMMIRPIRRLTRSMQAFSENPEDPARILAPDRGGDELAVAG